MRKLIAFVGQVSESERDAWMTALSQALEGEEIYPFELLNAEMRLRVEIAIVANPDKSELAQLSALKWVHSVWAGVENLVAESELSVPIVRLVDLNLAETMAEAVLAWCLYLHRDMPLYRRQQDQRIWLPAVHIPARKRTVGLLGLGEMGRAAANVLYRNGFNLIGWSRTAKKVANVTCFSGPDGLQDLLSRADILVCLLPHTAETAGILNAEMLAQMRYGASLINFGRGSLIDINALIAALDRGDLDHAVLDVFDLEPLPTDSPLWRHERVSVLPHISAPTDIESASAIVAKNICDYREGGSLPDIVDRARGY